MNETQIRSHRSRDLPLYKAARGVSFLGVDVVVKTNSGTDSSDGA
jgi:hypothetical protein